MDNEIIIGGKSYKTAQVQGMLDNEDVSDLSDSPTINSDHDSDEEYEIDEPLHNEATEPDENHSDSSNEDDSAGLLSEKYAYGKNRYKWSKIPPTLGRTRSHNIIVHLPGLKQVAKNLQNSDPINYWTLLITDEMINEIVKCTNEKITDLSHAYEKTASFVNYTDEVDMKAFFGLLYLTSIFKSNHEDVEGLFATDGGGRDIFRGTMSLKRFFFLLVSLRFDSISTRDDRKSYA